MRLPTKPIEKVTVICGGDPSVGIHEHSFDMGTFIDLDCYGGDEQDKTDILLSIKQSIKDTYTNMGCEPTRILFDYETEEEPQPTEDNES